MLRFDPAAPEIPTETVAGRRVLFLMAAEAEYGPALKKRLRPLLTGVGPVEAAIAAGVALSVARAAGQLPDLMVSLGSAGSRVLEQGIVYQASSVSWRDMDASALGFAKGVTPFIDHPVETALPTPLRGTPTARLSTGANIVSGAAYDGIDAEMVDMESFAILRACRRFSVPMIGLRGISDGAVELHHYDDWTSLLHVVDENLAHAVDRLGEALETGAPLVAAR